VPVAQPQPEQSETAEVSEEPEAGEASSNQFVELANKFPKLPVYISTFLLLGALAIPAILVHRRLSRFEKVLLCVAGAGQTTFCVLGLIAFIVWIAMLLMRVWNGEVDVFSTW